MDNQVYHIPALLPEAINALNIKPEGIYIDVTFGGGGHSRAIVEKLNDSGHLYGFDQDLDAINNAFSDSRLTLVHSNFRYITNFMRFHDHYGDVDGILADLGVSFHHFDDPDRGFSFRFDGPLDMRMNRNATKTAETVVNTYTEEQLAEIFRLYGELKNARKIASAIVKVRAERPITTTEQFLETVERFVDPRQQKKELAQIFQALRIIVNDEISALRDLLDGAIKVLKPGGRIAVITYHSLEDRLVKNFMKTGNLEGVLEKDFYGRSKSPLKLITSKPIIPSEQEIENNPRSRSAKMRVAEKI